MKFIKTFESYLEGGRQPLYHFTSHINEIIESNILKLGRPAKDLHGNRGRSENGLSSISLTRNPSFSDVSNRCRITFNTDTLIRNGYIPKPIDEVGVYLVRNRTNPNAEKRLKLRPYLKVNQHRLKKMKIARTDLEEEFEERIYKEIKNIGKYIEYIDISGILLSSQLGKSLMDYIKKYPQIVVRKLEEKEVFINKPIGNNIKKVPGDSTEILLNINIIRKMEREINLQPRVEVHP